MRLASFEVGSRASYGIVTAGGIVDGGARLGSGFPNLLSVLKAGALDRLEKMSGSPPDFRLDEVLVRTGLLQPMAEATV